MRECCSCTPVQRVLYLSACLLAGLGERHLGRHTCVRYTCSGPNVLELRGNAKISHTLLCSTVILLLMLLAARWWTLGVSTRVLGLLWDSCDLSFSYNSCFLFGFFMVLIWNVVSSSPLSPAFSFVPFLLDSALPPSIACVCTTYSSLCPVASRRARCQLKD